MGRTRAGLLAGAARAFAEHGLRRSTMQSIAAAAGVAKATLYNHFRTKDEVAAALLAAELDRLTALAESLPRDQALAALSDELGAHPVLRRLAETEPEVLTALLAVDAERWAELTARLAAALRVDDDGAELAGAVAAGRRPAARPVDDPPPARRPARRRARLTAQLQRQRRVSSTRSAPGPACPGEGAGGAPKRRAEAQDGGVVRAAATACTARAPTPAASAANRSSSRRATPRRRHAGWTASGMDDGQPVGADDAEQVAGVLAVRRAGDRAEPAELVEEERVVQARGPRRRRVPSRPRTPIGGPAAARAARRPTVPRSRPGGDRRSPVPRARRRAPRAWAGRRRPACS